MISSQRLSLKVIASSSFKFPSKPTANLKYYAQRVTRIILRMHTSSLKPCDMCVIEAGTGVFYSSQNSSEKAEM